MKQNLLSSFRLSNFYGGGVLFDWTQRFLDLAAEEGGTINVFNLTGSRQWQSLEKLIAPEKDFAETELFEKPIAFKPPADLMMNSRIEEITRAVTEYDFSNQKVSSHYEPKISLRSTFPRVMGVHRSGWKFALQSLLPLHSDSGILFDGSSDLRFDTKQQASLRKLENGWVGVFHHPPQMPEWFAPGGTPQKILASYNFKNLLESCHGIFCMSENHRDWLRKQIGVAVVALVLPTETPEIQFSFERFRANPLPRVVQIGHWLRKLNSIYLLPTNLRRTIVHQKFDLVNKFFEQEKNLYNLSVNSGEVEVLPFLSNLEYDNLLAENLVYLDLYDATANNAVIECIVRNTPVLVNPLPAVREHLGDEYPFYFRSRMEAARKAEDLSLIAETCDYLKNLPIKEKLTAEYFLQSVAESEIYRRLPV